MSTINVGELNIMLVEPSSTQYKVISEYLFSIGAKYIHHVKDGKTALDKIRLLKPDLVISAMYLPDITGVELVESLHSSKVTEDVAFILISSETDIRYLEPIRQAGAIAILPKPCKADQLEKALIATMDFIEPEALELDDQYAEDLDVLVVDDSRMSRHHIHKLLEGIGVERVTEAENGKEAISMLEQQRFDLIVTDYNMPEMDGKELVDFIRADTKFAGMPVLMITSETDESHLARIEQAGVSAICSKPFEAQTMKDLIKKVLS
ncbi:MAG: response regulator [Gammaproteobacteria bacterium]